MREIRDHSRDIMLANSYGQIPNLIAVRVIAVREPIKTNAEPDRRREAHFSTMRLHVCDKRRNLFLFHCYDFLSMSYISLSMV